MTFLFTQKLKNVGGPLLWEALGSVPEFSSAVILLTYPCLSEISNFFYIFSLYVGLSKVFFLAMILV